MRAVSGWSESRVDLHLFANAAGGEAEAGSRWSNCVSVAGTWLMADPRGPAARDDGDGDRGDDCGCGDPVRVVLELSSS